MTMYNLIEYSDNYSKTSGSLRQNYRDELGEANIVPITDSQSFRSKKKITGKTPADGNTKGVEIVVPLKYLSNSWRTLQILLIHCENNLILTWSSTYVITNSTGAGTFAITDTKIYVLGKTLSTNKNAKLIAKIGIRF